MIRTQQQGFAMIEILVSVLVLSIGLLGLAGLQTTGLKVNHSSLLRSEATLKAYDMLDRMRANMSAVSAGSYNNVDATATDPGCVSSNCSASQMAQYDAYEWNLDLADALPSGQGQVTGDGSNFTITVMWDDNRTGTSGTDCGAGDLICFQVSAQL